MATLLLSECHPIIYSNWTRHPGVTTGSLSGSGNVWFTNTTTTLTLGGDNSSTLFDGILNQVAPGTGQLVKTGTGSFTFKGMSMLTGATVVNNGTFVADGSMAGGITVNSGATLAGAGSVGAVTLNSGATFLPGTVFTNAATTNRMTTLSATSLAFAAGATLTFNMYCSTNYTQIVANGPVDLGGATMQVNFLYKPAANDVFYIVLNNSASATTGKFAGMSEGAQVALGNGYYGKVSYVATGDATTGNDVKIYNVTTGVPGTTIFFR